MDICVTYIPDIYIFYIEVKILKMVWASGSVLQFHSLGFDMHSTQVFSALADGVLSYSTIQSGTLYALCSK